ncbi:hypothetical protein SERLA73DRAFT_190524 [Serpula lacrymans var. lacrymans S7.3]|uniref:NADH dehydrogenase [ubiquinone] 1 alpha subcomplex subunit n=2 Tax=Serpula lacrymans var. lacrymans TaxID=341189 RepID=F8QFS4_SERL3|nr:uncharacterized protein SERLADRAFT_457930 [Serpula lacrymans var. lacrymans S7.9]EGN92908.1 hypothetical protein SERLA73DRAFT_190524 [Serpula lacrymans var. lacrymans S7.3]EGO29739.1 hypothetical protein SERLADRAFT_457930 [Serpula lacrymans var. lacrymans S7.9]
MSLFARLWQRIGTGARFVGKDLEGNKFYERPSSTDDPLRTKRSVKYRNPDDMWHYIGGGRRLPVQWSTWLTHTRPNPPTIEVRLGFDDECTCLDASGLEELHFDLARQQRVVLNAAILEAKDRDERARTAIGPEDPPTLPHLEDSRSRTEIPEGLGRLDPVSQEPTRVNPPRAPGNAKEHMKGTEGVSRPRHHATSDEPQPWVPKSRAR